MMHEPYIIKAITQATGHKCYLDYIPNKAQLPALALTSIGSIRNERDLSGSKVGSVTEHRVAIVSESMLEIQEISICLESLDNQATDDLSKIMINFSSRDPHDGSGVFRVLYNLTSFK